MIINYRFANVNEKDAYEIAYVTAKSWYDTYNNIMPIEYLKSRLNNIDKSVIKTKNFLANSDDYLVCEIDNKIVGFCYYRPSENEKYKNYGCLAAIYLLKEYHGLGIGKEMFKKAVKGLIDKGYNTMYLECAVGNNTINFYKKYGGVITDTIDYSIKDFSIKVDIVEYEDLNKVLNLLNNDIKIIK